MIVEVPNPLLTLQQDSSSAGLPQTQTEHRGPPNASVASPVRFACNSDASSKAYGRYHGPEHPLTDFWARPANAIICDLNRATTEVAPMTKVARAFTDLLVYQDAGVAWQRLRPNDNSVEGFVVDALMNVPYVAGVARIAKWKRISRAADPGHGKGQTAATHESINGSHDRNWPKAYGIADSLEQKLDNVLTTLVDKNRMTSANRDRVRSHIDDLVARAVAVSDLQHHGGRVEETYAIAEAELRTLSNELKTLLDKELRGGDASNEIQTWFKFVTFNVLRRVALREGDW